MKTVNRLPGAMHTIPVRPDGPTYALRKKLQKFHRDESGAMIAFALICFIGMLVGAGMAVDFMRFENTRTQLQNTLDRSLLAAASLNQTLAPEDVVADYFAKSGLKDYSLTVTVDEGLNYRTVSAVASSTVDSLFLNMVGIDSMLAMSNASAEKRIQNVEISIVLDISGSMGSYSRLRGIA
jgi:Flp pilus assembly protein TadG